MDTYSATVPRLSYSIEEFSLATGLSRATLYRMIADEQLETVKVRGRRLVPAWQAQQLLERPVDEEVEA